MYTTLIVVGLIIFIFFTVYVFCCRKGENEKSSGVSQVDPPFWNRGRTLRTHTSYESTDGGTGVTVTTHSAAVAQPPYPIDPRHPTPYAAAPPQPGFAGGFGQVGAPYPTSGAAQYPTPGAAPYPTPGAAPYPTPGAAPYHPSGHAPYPLVGQATMGSFPPVGNAPYPTNSSNDPPSYFEATGQVPVPHPRKTESYVKQEPYNPHF